MSERLNLNCVVLCRCGRTNQSPWRCNHPARPPLLCRLGLHRWGITTWPIMTRWCERCGEKGIGR